MTPHSEPCPAGCEALTIEAAEGIYFDEVWDEEHESAWQCTWCGRIFAEDRYGEPVQVWPIRVADPGEWRSPGEGGDDLAALRHPVAVVGTGANSTDDLTPDPEAPTSNHGPVSVRRLASPGPVPACGAGTTPSGSRGTPSASHPLSSA